MASKAIEEAEETSESVKQKRKLNSDSCLDGEIKMMIASITCSDNKYFKDIDAQLGKSDSNAFFLVI